MRNAGCAVPGRRLGGGFPLETQCTERLTLWANAPPQPFSLLSDRSPLCCYRSATQAPVMVRFGDEVVHAASSAVDRR